MAAPDLAAHDDLAAAIVVLAADGAILRGNRAWTELVGGPVRDGEARFFWDLVADP
jgi:hypothetical protein